MQTIEDAVYRFLHSSLLVARSCYFCQANVADLATLVLERGNGVSTEMKTNTAVIFYIGTVNI